MLVFFNCCALNCVYSRIAFYFVNINDPWREIWFRQWNFTKRNTLLHTCRSNSKWKSTRNRRISLIGKYLLEVLILKRFRIFWTPHCTDCDQCMKVCRKHNAISIGVTFFCTWNMQVALHCNSLFKNRGVKQTSDKKNEQTLDHFCVEYFFFSIKDNNFSSHNLYLSYAMIYLDLRRECVGFFIHVLKCFQFGIDWSKRVENSNQPFRIGDSISKLVTETNVVI